LTQIDKINPKRRRSGFLRSRLAYLKSATAAYVVNYEKVLFFTGFRMDKVKSSACMHGGNSVALNTEKRRKFVLYSKSRRFCHAYRPKLWNNTLESQ
jgi:hypothetical protein